MDVNASCVLSELNGSECVASRSSRFTPQEMCVATDWRLALNVVTANNLFYTWGKFRVEFIAS
jgi:hypothetical protein